MELRKSLEFGTNFITDWAGNNWVSAICFYFKDGDKWITVDNTEGCCFVEEFKTEREAIDYLTEGN